MAASINTFVVDASFILASLFPDEPSPESDTVIRKYLESEIKLISSPIFELEVLNGLRAAQLSKRIELDLCLSLAQRFLKLSIFCEEVDSYEVLRLAQQLNLTVYDASYVYLARSKTMPLLAHDRRMRRLAKSS